MILGTRAHDIQADSALDLCRKLKSIGMDTIQFAPHKSFPDLVYSEQAIREIAGIFHENGIHTAVYGAYIDPCTPEGVERFLEQIKYAAILNAGMIATETALKAESGDVSAKYGLLADAFRSFADKAEQLGVDVAVEMVSIHPIATPELMIELLRAVGSERLRVVLDPINLASPTSKGEQQLKEACEQSQRAIQLFGERIGAVHYKKELAHGIRPVLEAMPKDQEICVLLENVPFADMPGERERILSWLGK